jgi:MoxR-like ATPase
MGELDFFDPEFLADPYPVFHRLRAEDPVHRHRLGFYVLTRYDDVAAFLRDARFGKGGGLARGKVSAEREGSPPLPCGSARVQSHASAARPLHGIIPTMARPRDLHAQIGRLEANLSRALVGKAEVVRLAVVGLLARGHLLIEDVPGVGKTTLAAALARSLGVSFQRIQFTSDMLPSDVLGVAVYEPDKHEFVFKPGPIFTNIVLADEINRTTPKTQSSLLEAMNEAQVSLDHTTHPLPRPFMVLATQNPREHAGTFPLPESQLDRFLLRIRIGYPSEADERTILRGAGLPGAQTLETVLDAADVLELQEAAEAVRVEDSVLDYMLSIVTATRRSRLLSLGVSPRGSLALLRAARAHALADGRNYLVPDDVKRLAVPALAHRVLLAGSAADGAGAGAEAVIRTIVQDVPVPR